LLRRPDFGRDGALRRPRRRAKRQATESLLHLGGDAPFSFSLQPSAFSLFFKFPCKSGVLSVSIRVHSWLKSENQKEKLA
jgi:hypothetical protein